MVCNIIDECRCFAYSDVVDTKRYQFCGVIKGPRVMSCPSECCAGGCPSFDNEIEPREPFKIIKRPKFSERGGDIDIKIVLILVYILTVIIFMMYVT